MTMTMQPIKNDQAAATLTSKQMTPLATSHLAPQSQKAPSGTDKSDGSDKISAKDVLSGAATAHAKEATSRLSALQSGKDASALQVLAVHTSSAVDEQMESAQQKMNEIVDSYPPFLRGSEQRQKYLMSISSIRAQIEAMTIPPGKLDNPALDAASSGGAKKMWANLFKNVGIPALASNGPNEASDAQIKAASSAVGAMQSDLSGRRAVLEQHLISSTSISSSEAQYMSQAAGQGLAKTSLPLTTSLTGALKGM